jgi:hypothetical protein
MQGDSDAIVPLSSQFNGDLTYSVTTSGASQNTFPAIHSLGISTLGFLPPTGNVSHYTGLFPDSSLSARLFILPRGSANEMRYL